MLMLSAVGRGMLLAATSTVVSISAGSWPRFLALERLHIWKNLPDLYLRQAIVGYVISSSLIVLLAYGSFRTRQPTRSALRRLAFKLTLLGWLLSPFLVVAYGLVSVGIIPFIATALIGGALSAVATAAAAPTVFEVFGLLDDGPQ